MMRRHMAPVVFMALCASARAEDPAVSLSWKPYTAPCVERDQPAPPDSVGGQAGNVFEFTEKPKVKILGNDQYEITFAAKGNCDATVGIVDEAGKVVRHLGSGVLGSNAPDPFQKNSLKQTIYWNGKDDLGFYVKEPQKTSVRVMLGLNPVFDRNLGSASPYDIPGWVWGITGDADGMYVFSIGHKGRMFLRKFGHDMKYIGTLMPPPVNLPESKMEGMGYVEYEPGRRAVHHPDAYETIDRNGSFLPMKFPSQTCRPASVNGRIWYVNGGGLVPSFIYHVGNDGSTDAEGCADRPFLPGKTALNAPNLAASPDGKWIYMVDGGEKGSGYPVLWRCAGSGSEPGSPLVGAVKRPGSDNSSFNGACGIDTDRQGRIYVCDRNNQRLQIFSPEGKHLQTLKIDMPEWVAVHQKTGEVYVKHDARSAGKGISRLSKHTPFPEMKKMFHFDGMVCSVAMLDSWSGKPRIWTAIAGEGVAKPRSTVRVWEEDSGSFRMVLDFHEEGQRIAGANSIGFWHGSIRNKVACDGRRERVYLSHIGGWFCFDLRTGKLLEYVRSPGATDDVAFDKKGYMHLHFNPGFYQRGVGRLDPDQAEGGENPDFKEQRHLKAVRYKEAPYDYGIQSEKNGWSGILDVRDQPGSKYFQDGLGVNMRGDVAEECNIWFAPRFDDIGKLSVEGPDGRQTLQDAIARGRGLGSYTSVVSYDQFAKQIAEQEKRGIQTAAIPRQPGVYLTGGTVWTFDSTGERRDEFAVIAGNLINGVQIDEDGKLYFTVSRPRLRGGKVFLAGRQGVFGGKSGEHPFMGTHIKSAGKNVKVLTAGSPYAPVPLDQKPDRAPEVGSGFSAPRSKDAEGASPEFCWVEGAEWFYAGSSPIVRRQPCSCYTMRNGLDWYKRSYVLEQYRHSIAVLDTNGNLILHMGQYGNLDSGQGAQSRIPLGGDNIAMSFVENVSATDNYICYDDNGERLASVKITYHAEETVGIGK